MDEFVEWLREQPQAQGRIRHHRHEPAREAEYGDIELHDRVTNALDVEGIDRLYRHQTAAIESIRDGRNSWWRRRPPRGRA